MGSAFRPQYTREVPRKDLTIEVCDDPGDEHVAAITRLLPQLSSVTPPDLEVIASVARSEATSLLFARDDAEVIVGTLSLVTFRIPTGVRAIIEDVVVDEAARGRGVASALVRHAIEIASVRGARTVELTSRPSREAANRLYMSLGFVPRETNIYRYSLE